MPPQPPPSPIPPPATGTSATTEPHKPSTTAHIETVTLARLTEADVARLARDALVLRSRTGLRLLLIMCVMGCNQAGYGVDWSVISGINAMDAWHGYFGFGTSGATYATLNALMTVGGVVGAPFLGLADIIGRRGINFTGNAIVIAAAVMQGCAQNMPTFMAGRFFLGFGSTLMSSSTYMGEIAPVHMRGRLVGIFGACYQVGSIVMSGLLMALTQLPGNWQWRLPLLLEAFFPLIVCATIFVVTPESPRYLVRRGKVQQAREVIAKYHTNSDDTNQGIVNVVISQIEESLESERVDRNKWWDFRIFLTKIARYRLLVLVLYSIFQQWNGGSIISYYLVPTLETIGITASMSQLGINLGLTATYFLFTTCGAYLIDRFRRRPLIFAGLLSIILLQTASTLTSWRFAATGSPATAALTLAWIFGFQIASSLLIATMHNLYPIEILSLPLRARGMGVYALVQGAAGCVQSYGIGVGIEKVGYRIWCVYIVYNTLQLLAAYFVFPETFGLNLEEIDYIFETKGVNPVRMSLDIQRAKRERARLAAQRKQEEHGVVEVK